MDKKDLLKKAIIDNDLEKVKEIVESGFDIETYITFKRTALHWASLQDRPDILRYLINKGANLNVRQSDDNWTPLHVAVINNHLECVKILVEAGADVGLKTRTGKTALGIAMKEGYEKIVKYLSSNVMFISKKLNYDRDLLHKASIKGDEEILMIMIKRGIDINTKQEDDGWTALHLASYNGNFRCVKILVEAGADMGLKTGSIGADKRGLTALELAEERGFTEVVDYLKLKQRYLSFEKFMKF